MTVFIYLEYSYQGNSIEAEYKYEEDLWWKWMQVQQELRTNSMTFPHEIT